MGTKIPPSELGSAPMTTASLMNSTNSSQDSPILAKSLANSAYDALLAVRFVLGAAMMKSCTAPNTSICVESASLMFCGKLADYYTCCGVTWTYGILQQRCRRYRNKISAGANLVKRAITHLAT